MNPRVQETLEPRTIIYEGDTVRYRLTIPWQNSVILYWVKLFAQGRNVSRSYLRGKSRVHGNVIISPEIRGLRANTPYTLIFRHTQQRRVVDTVTDICVKYHEEP